MTYNRIKSAVEETPAVVNPLTALSSVQTTLESARDQLSAIEMEDVSDEIVINDLLGSVLATIEDVKEFLISKTTVNEE